MIYIKIDIKNVGEYDNIVAKVEEITKDEGLNVLFNNAGIAPKQKRFGFLKEKDLVEALTTNTVAPIMFAQVINLNFYL